MIYRQLRHILIISLLLSLTNNLCAQEAQSSSVQVSAARVIMYNSPGDINGFGVSVAFNKGLSQHFGYSLEYEFAHGIRNPKSLQPLNERTIHSFDVRVRVLPFAALKGKVVQAIFSPLGFKIGPSFFIGSALTESEVTVLLDPAGREINRSSVFEQGQMRDVGLRFGVFYTRDVGKRCFAGASLDLSAYLNSEGYSQVAGVFGIRL